MILAFKARSPQLAAAAQLLAASWIASVALWRWAGDSELRAPCLAGVDLLLAAVFLRMSRRRVFPAPLCVLHGGLVIHYATATVFGSTFGWIAAFANRAFEVAVVYVAGCALFRLRRRARKEARSP